ncbi:ribonuclease H family protein [Clostridium sp.]|uniref:ribonuclease H family protein n=1 Tax=Clostridium sp. TaxID=1506 RepID=UPI0032163F80
MAIKYYAIKKGIDLKTNKDVSNIIVNSWNECLNYVKGVKGAVYKSFVTKEEANEYLNSCNALKKGIDEYPLMVPHIYVDGSYNATTSNFGYGLVVIDSDVIIHASYGGGCNKECNQRQVNGELRAAIEGIEYAVANKCEEVVVFYDYEGVCQHATGSWERNTTLSKEYYETINNLKTKGNLKVIFVKVDSHTNDLYNDIADELAKTGAGVNIDNVVDKAINDISIQVESYKVKEVLSQIIDKNLEKVKCVNDFFNNINEEKVVNSGNIIDIISCILSLADKDVIGYLESLEDSIKNEVIIGLVNKLR